MTDRKFMRNFCIISHVNHGKSTLADRFLELTKTVPAEKMRPQYLNSMDLERGKGITIKMHPVRMCWNVGRLKCWNENDKTFPTSEQSERSNKRSDQTFILNLIDTPGHVDFSYEVSRSLAAVEGAILLVDASQGIQAQTLANFELAKKQGLTIIPAVNKIDLPQAKVEETKKELADLLEISPEEIFAISAKLGTNTRELLEAVIEKVPPPKTSLLDQETFRALIFDSKYDSFKGVICYVRVFDGEIKNGEKIYLMAGKIEGKVKELGYFGPEFLPQQKLSAGEIGYIATGIKETGKVRVGDTIISLKFKVESMPRTETKFLVRGLELPRALAGYQEPKPMVFASFYPENSNDFEILEEALMKLKLNDASLTFQPERKEGLGRGFLGGFLGSLHIEIVAERLKREYGLALVISTPSVIYKILTQKNQELLIFSPGDWPEPSMIKEIQEPWMKLEIITPPGYLGQVLKIFENSEAIHIEKKFFGQNRLLLIYEIPLREIIIGFYDKLKGASQGFASMNYQFLEYRKADLIKLEILVAGKKEEAFSKIVPKNRALEEGRKIVAKLKEILPAQLFSVAIQAVISGKIIARETIKAKGRDVTAPLYGGDFTRKRKLLEKQKKGKKRLKERGQVRIPPQVYLKMFSQ